LAQLWASSVHRYASALGLLTAVACAAAAFQVAASPAAPDWGAAAVAAFAAAVLCGACVTVRVNGESTYFSLTEVPAVLVAGTLPFGLGLLALAVGSATAHVVLLRRSGLPALVTTCGDVLAVGGGLLLVNAVGLGGAPSGPAKALAQGAVVALAVGCLSAVAVSGGIARATGRRTLDVVLASVNVQVAVSALAAPVGATFVLLDDEPGSLGVALACAAAVAVLSSARVRERRHRELLDQLLTQITELNALLDAEELATHLVQAAKDLTRARDVWLRDRAPEPGEIGTRLPRRSGADQWLVALPRPRQSAMDRHDEKVLATLATAAATALDNAELHAQLSGRVARDELTGLLNKATFMEAVAHEIARADRAGTRFGLLFLDLDRFKQVNDTLGHLTGDQLLRLVADRLRTAFRGADVPARFGGDEFAVLLPQVSTPAQLEAARQRLTDAFAERVHLNGTDVTVRPSSGGALYPADGADERALVDHADAVMLSEKRKGRDTAEVEPRVPDPR
jgi:diguanylate cyclase (GGDEF)-like protein